MFPPVNENLIFKLNMRSPDLSFFIYIFNFKKLILEREQEHSICCSIHLCIHWLILVWALTQDLTTTFAYQVDALTHLATQPG